MYMQIADDYIYILFIYNLDGKSFFCSLSHLDPVVNFFQPVFGGDGLMDLLLFE